MDVTYIYIEQGDRHSFCIAGLAISNPDMRTAVNDISDAIKIRTGERHGPSRETVTFLNGLDEKPHRTGHRVTLEWVRVELSDSVELESCYI